MAERKIKLPLGPLEVDATEVDISSRKEGLYEYHLEDGSVVRLALVPMQVVRLENAWDADGNPTYLVKHNILVTTISAPSHLRRK